MKSSSRRDPESIAVDLTSPEPRDRILAAQALGHMGASAESATSALVEILADFATYREDGTPHVVSVEAAQALRQINPNLKVSPKMLSRLARMAAAPAEHELLHRGWVARCGSQVKALVTLGMLGPMAQPVLPDLARLNRNVCTEGRALEAAQSIGPFTPDQLPRLEASMGDPNPDVRRSVAEFIGASHISGGAEILGRAMNDVSSAVRLSALESLEKIHPEGQGRVSQVKPFLEDDSPDIRRQALHLLLRIAPDASLTMALLKDRLSDPDSSLAMETAQALSRAHPRDPMLIEALIRIAKGMDLETGPQAAELLKTSGSHDPKVAEALAPYRERERQQQIEKAVLSTTPQERASNARTLRVNAIQIAKGIKAEQPDHAARVFSAKSGRLFCWTTLSATTTPAAVRYVWYRDGQPVHEATLAIPDSPYSLWTSSRVRPGKWHVDIFSPESGEALASVSFTVTKE